MAKRNIHSDELAVETTDNELYRRNPDGTYTKITSGGASHVNLRNSSGVEITSLGGIMGAAAFSSGTLGGTTRIVSMLGAPLPSTVILDSSDGTRKIQWSADGGTEYFDAIYDYTNANELVFIVDAPITHIKFTGLSADTYRIG